MNERKQRGLELIPIRRITANSWMGWQRARRPSPS